MSGAGNALVVLVNGDTVTATPIASPPKTKAAGIGGVACVPSGGCLLAGITQKNGPLLERLTWG